MKKTATLLLICLVSLNLLRAQTSGGPDAYGYIWKNNFAAGGPVYNWIDIVPLTGAQNVRFLGDDNTVGSFPIGFPFHFYWYDVTQFWVGSNGYIGFTNGQISSPFPAIPNTLAPQNFIAAMASDLIFGAPTDTASCWRWTNAAADTLIVSYIGVPFYATGNPGWTGSNTFQIILSAIDSSITFQYKEQVGTTLTTAGNVISVGIENNSGQIGLQQSLNTYPIANYAVKFTYPSNTTYQVSDASTTFNNNAETGGLFLSNNGSPFTMNTSIKNTGNQNLSAFNVFSRVVNNTGTIQTPATATVLSNALTPGQTQSITISTPNVFSPTVLGTYKYISSTQLTGDITPSNDTKTQELVVVDTTAANIRLTFDKNSPAFVGLNWTGGQGGGGIYFVPPFYPCKVTQMLSYITTNDSSASFSMEAFQDNGPGGTPGSLLDSEFVAAGSVVPHSWNSVPLATPAVINSGGVYIAWSMGGPGITLGLDTVAPFSNRTFEVISNTWAIYRSREVQDLMINIVVQKIVNHAGVNELSMNDYFGQFAPNPSTTYSTLNFELPSDINSLSYEIMDVQGKLIQSKNLNHEIHSGRLTINSEQLNAGIYTCKINVDGNKVVRKLVVMK